MNFLRSTRVTAIATTLAVMLGGAAIALATHAAAPTATDLPGIASSRLPTATAESIKVPASGPGSSTPDLVPSPATTETPTTAGGKKPGSNPAVDLPTIPSTPDSPAGAVEHDDDEDDHELVTPPVREDDDDDADDASSSDTDEERSEAATSTNDSSEDDE